MTFPGALTANEWRFISPKLPQGRMPKRNVVFSTRYVMYGASYLWRHWSRVKCVVARGVGLSKKENSPRCGKGKGIGFVHHILSNPVGGCGLLRTKASPNLHPLSVFPRISALPRISVLPRLAPPLTKQRNKRQGLFARKYGFQARPGCSKFDQPNPGLRLNFPTDSFPNTIRFLRQSAQIATFSPGWLANREGFP